jgi:hypothetical protein
MVKMRLQIFSKINGVIKRTFWGKNSIEIKIIIIPNITAERTCC